MQTLIELDGVYKTYNDGQPVEALKPSHVRLQTGEYVTVTGPSGSGKSTLLNILAMLDRPTGGAYRLRGVEVADLPKRVVVAVRGQMFGFVFQSFHLLAGRTALENVELGMLYGPHGPKMRRLLALEALETVQLAARVNADPRTLSGGEKQRVAIARAIAGRPDVLFCDEPTGNLDSANSQNVLAILNELNALGITIVVVTHDREVASDGHRELSVIDGLVTEADACAANR